MTTLSRITRLSLASTLALTLTACASDSGGAGQAGAVLYGIVSEGLFGEGEEKPAPPAQVPRDMVAKLQYASIGVTIDNNPQFLFLLANTTPTDEIYTFGYQVSVVLRGGRLIRTQGLMDDVLGGRWQGEDIVKTSARTGAPVTGVRWMETNERGIGTREATCTATSLADEIVTILDTPIVARHVREDCEVPELKWKFTNHFWLIPETGQVWMSVQNVTPRASPLVIQTLRPAAQPAAAAS
jgi:hypothetical protein